jgi:hypothetical protein
MAYEAKTKLNDGDVKAFLESVENDARREDAWKILDIIGELTGEEGKMWGKTIVGFGLCKLKYADGRLQDWMEIGFSPRKQALTLYIQDYTDKYKEDLSRLGKHKTGKSCLYINRLEQVDLDVLREIIGKSISHIRSKEYLET